MLEPYQADCLSILPGIRHGFFTCQGGVSQGIYQSLNCGMGSNDGRVAVIENRARVAQHLGSPLGDVQTLYQVHSTNVLTIGTPTPREDLAKADALVTKTRGLAIGVLTADCSPVLFADSQARIVGAAHAGWRGALGGVVEATVAAMVKIGASRAGIRAAVGPCINQEAYEVGPEFEQEFRAKDPAYGRFFKRNSVSGRPHFDLPGFVLEALTRTGIGKAESVAICTHRNESLFFSYRRSQQRSQSDYGRQISAIVVT
jgi:hypothetical protein